MKMLHRQKLKQELGKLQRQLRVVQSTYRYFVGLLGLYVVITLFYIIFVVQIKSLVESIIALILLVIYFLVIQIYHYRIIKRNFFRLRDESKRLLDIINYVINFIDWKVYRKKVVNENNSFLDAQATIGVAVDIIRRPFNPLYNPEKCILLNKCCYFLRIVGLLYGLLSIGGEIL